MRLWVHRTLPGGERLVHGEHAIDALEQSALCVDHAVRVDV
jgi:hypothetical protein